MAGGSASRKYDDVLVSRDLVDVVNLPTATDEFTSAPHKPLQMVLRAKQCEGKIVVQQVPMKIPGYIGGEVKVKNDFKKEEEKASRLCFLNTLPMHEKSDGAVGQKKRTKPRQEYYTQEPQQKTTSEGTRETSSQGKRAGAWGPPKRNKRKPPEHQLEVEEKREQQATQTKPHHNPLHYCHIIILPKNVIHVGGIARRDTLHCSAKTKKIMGFTPKMVSTFLLHWLLSPACGGVW